MVTDLRATQLSTDVGSGPRCGQCADAPLKPHPDFPHACPLMDWRGFHTELQRAAIAATQTGAPLSLLMLELGRFRSGSTEPRGSEVAAAELAALAGCGQSRGRRARGSSRATARGDWRSS